MRPVPRLFVVRHGETEWSISGQHTGRTDIPLTKKGEESIRSKASNIVGTGKLIDPATLGAAIVSPLQRAKNTFHILFEAVPEDQRPQPIIADLNNPKPDDVDVREWHYGDYEGLLAEQIHERNPKWTIWYDGCPGGESVEEMTERVDKVIAKVHEIHRLYFEEGKGKRDVILVAHGHFNRVLISRWIEFKLCLGTHFNVEPASVALLTYNHRNLKEPALTGLNLYAL